MIRALGFAKSNGDVRRVAQQNGLRLITESEGGQDQITLTIDDAREPAAASMRWYQSARCLDPGEFAADLEVDIAGPGTPLFLDHAREWVLIGSWER